MLKYVTLTLSFLCLTLLVANAALFEFTVICMEDENHALHFSSYEQGILLGVISIGCILGTYPSIKLHDYFGFKYCFTLMGLLSAVGTLVVPLFGHMFYVILLDQLIQGVALASAFLALGVLPAAIGDDSQSGFFGSILTCSMQLGPILVMPVSGCLCSSHFGWQGAYVLFSAFTTVAFLLFFVVYEKYTERKQLSLIKGSYLEINSLHDENENETSSVPYRLIFASASFWGLMFVDFGDTCGYQLFMFYGPTYLNKVLHYEIEETGFFAAVPHLLSMLSKTVGGFFLDRSSCVSAGLRTMLFIAVSEMGMVLSFAVLAFVTAETAFLGQVMLNMLTVFSGLAFIGMISGSHIVGQQYAYLLTSAIAVQDSIAGLAVPLLVSLIAPNYAEQEWKLVFLVLTTMLLATTCAFLLLTKVEPAKWTMTQIK
uniref:MFS domain-containing protein n=1 Tax=Steinernema glaseri TaxID=37863 RepID=A0A1I8AN98_9BILA